MTEKEKLVIKLIIIPFTLVFLIGYIPYKIIETIGMTSVETLKILIKPNYIETIKEREELKTIKN